MFKWRRLRRERLEVYLVYMILVYRTLIRFGGIFLLVYAIVVMFMNPLAGGILLLPAIYPFLLDNSYGVVLCTARLGAWIGTLGRPDD